ncbi:MAG TPA: bifunctional phosphopantothenoylcysteine decarboxylase/phosphopantothenate--cysteine ligase CoaBC [Acidobacteriota bacterium]|nr:bifunctional phosphopantothenoylcysteine decarboxylase/phosphopantothenate--cysteine ligase CoaBC [Acidobacteriota bacterium]
MSLKGKKIITGMTGGIACYKIPYLVRSLVREEAEVRVIMTPNATRFITPLTMETVSNNPVAVEMFPENRFVSTHHIDLAEWPDLFVIAPATANFMGKVAGGICDDLLTTVICASPRPVIVAPAMNPGMWDNPVTRKNADYLKQLKYQIIGPAEGEMACDHWGIGRMVEPDALLKAVKDFFKKTSKKKALSGKRVLVTAGPCREPLDPVRFLSNRSSGRMGHALARAAAELGAETTLVSGPTALDAPVGVDFVSIETTAELFKAVSRRFKRTDVLIMAAAPADFRPAAVSSQKIKKQRAALSMQLERTTDILATLGLKKKSGQILVGFAVETENGEANARRKLREKNLDLIVLNNPCDAGAAFEHETNQVTVLSPGRRAERWPLMAKDALSVKLLEKVARML